MMMGNDKSNEESTSTATSPLQLPSSPQTHNPNNPNNPTSTTTSSTLQLRIKNSSHPSNTTTTITTSTSSTILQLKETVRNALGPSSHGRYIRLIANGRLLAPDSSRVKEFGLKKDAVVHVVVAAAGVRGGQQASLSSNDNTSSSTSNNRRNRGAGIGSNGLVLRRNNTHEESDEDDVEEGRERRGFDRLRSEGLTRNEIAALRIYFSRHVDRFIEQRNQLRDNNNNDTSTSSSSSTNNHNTNNNSNNNNNNDDDDPEATARTHRLEMEQQWMDLQGPHSEFRLNLNANNPLLGNRMYLRTSLPSDPNDPFSVAGVANSRFNMLGTDRDFIWGFVLGYLVGFMMMFWVWMPTVPHKQKLGILTGICFQIALEMLKSPDSIE